VLAVLAQLTHFYKQHTSNWGRVLPLSQKPLVKQATSDRPIISINVGPKAGFAPYSSINSAQHTARKRSVQERSVDLSLARALLGGIGSPHHGLSEQAIGHK